MSHDGEGTTKPDELEKKQGTFSAPVLTEETTRLSADRVAAEINLESIGYFKAGYKRDYPTVPKEAREVAVGEARYRFIPSSFGYPNTDDLDFYRGLLKICEEQAECVEAADEQGKPCLTCNLPDPITFSTDKLLRYSGRQDSAPNRQAVRDFIQRHKNTGIVGVMKKKLPNGELAEVLVQGDSWFRGYVIVGELREGKKATQNAISFALWFRSNYERRYLKLVDVAFHQRLGTPIAKTLAPVLDSGWYATGGKAWQKKYSDLAVLLGIQCYRYLSKIKEKLDPSHEELKRERYLEEWEYTKAADRTGYVITWWPGEKWWEDQREYDRRRSTAAQLERVARTKVKQREFRFQKPKPEAVSIPAPALTAAEQEAFQHVRQVVSPYFTLAIFQQFLRKGVTAEDIQQGALACANAEKAALISTDHRLSYFMDYIAKLQASITNQGGGEAKASKHYDAKASSKSASSSPSPSPIPSNPDAKTETTQIPPAPAPISDVILPAGKLPAAVGELAPAAPTAELSVNASTTPPSETPAEPAPPQGGGGETA